jgi:hypothetical protein
LSRFESWWICGNNLNLNLPGICPGQARAAILLLFSHATGALRASSSTHVATLHHAGGDLHPLRRDVSGGAAVGEPVPAFPRDAPNE